MCPHQLSDHTGAQGQQGLPTGLPTCMVTDWATDCEDPHRWLRTARRILQVHVIFAGGVKMSEPDDKIHADGAADGPEHEGPSLGLDSSAGPPPTPHGPGDAPAGSEGTGGIHDGVADGSSDLTVPGHSFDGAVDSPVVDPSARSGEPIAESQSPGYDRDWQDEGADGPGGRE